MKTLAAFAVAASFGLSGCCFGAASPRVAAAPAPVPVRAAAPAPRAPEKVTIALEVNFDTSKSIVKPEYDSQLKKVADFLAAYPDARAEIEGHTDNMGSPEANKGLSQRRADAVRQALIDRFGVDASRLTAAGYGQERPLVANDTPENRAQNRRVAATFTGTK